MGRLLKVPRLLACVPGLLAFSAGIGVCAQEASPATDSPFVAATPDNILKAVQTCVTSKTDNSFDTAQIRKSGWRRLSPPGGMRDGQSMFANRPSGASITIGASEAGPDSACVIIGWVDNRTVAETVSREIEDELGLELQAENAEVARAQRAGWTYTIAFFTRPDVTSQTRMIVVIAPTEDDANS